MSFSFGNFDLGTLLWCSEIKRAALPSRRLEQTEVSGMDGCLVRDNGLEPLKITVGVIMRAETADDVAESRRILADALKGGAKRLILPDEPERCLMAYYQGGDSWGSAIGNPEASLTFLCADPVAYGQGRTASVGTAATAIRSGGTYKAWPVVTCKPAKGSSWTFTNITTGDYVCVEATFTGTQTVVLDMANERCTVNGADHAVTLGSDFFAIDGDCELKASSGTATLEWTERWL